MKKLYVVEFLNGCGVGLLERCYVPASSDEDALKKAKEYIAREYPDESAEVSSFRLLSDGTFLK